MQQDVEKNSKAFKQQDIENALLLAQIPNFSVAKLEKLSLQHGINLDMLRHSSQASLLQLGFNQAQIQAISKPDLQLNERCFAWLNNKAGRFILPFNHAYYPSLLKQIGSPPVLLFGYGDPQKLNAAQIAMVGSRAPTPSGKALAKQFACQLAECGWTITSGMAVGIDGCSHQGALLAKKTTIAVLGTAIDKLYPKRHISLAQEIMANDGVIISEFAPQTKSRPEFFPRRNRIISGLTLGTLIVEAALKSGSLITAKYAMEQNREVFAIPGSIQNPLSAGCHHLIQQGAKLVTTITDINEEFEHLILTNIKKTPKTEKNQPQSLATDRLLDSVDFEVTPLDIVAQRSGIDVTEVMSQLLEYELRGLVATVNGGYIKLGEK
ncbi:DNA-processing protein DprA [Paraglaciecola aestuariivivens]